MAAGPNEISNVTFRESDSTFGPDDAPVPCLLGDDLKSWASFLVFWASRDFFVAGGGQEDGRHKNMSSLDIHTRAFPVQLPGTRVLGPGDCTGDEFCSHSVQAWGWHQLTLRDGRGFPFTLRCHRAGPPVHLVLVAPPKRAPQQVLLSPVMGLGLAMQSSYGLGKLGAGQARATGIW